MTRRVFVTGAAGFIGGHLCRRLLAGGEEVVALVRRESPELASLGARVVRGDLHEPASYAEALRGCHEVVHLAGEARFGDGPEFEYANVDGTRQLLANVDRAEPPRRLLFVSSFSAMDRRADDRCDDPLTEASACHPTSDYGRSKLRAEELVAGSGIPWSIVRPAMVVGAGMRAESHIAFLVAQAARGAPVSRFAWPGAMSVIHVEDLVDAILRVLRAPEAEGGTYLAGGDAVALRELFEWAAPGGRRLPVAPLLRLLRPLLHWTPFRLKAMLLPALTVDDARLRGLGWRPRHAARVAVEEVILRERARVDARRTPPGRTLITGAASGLGRAVAERLGPSGRRLVLLDRDGPGLDAVLKGRPEVERLVCDVADPRALEDLVGSAGWTREPILEAFLCAGIGLRGRFASLALEAQVQILEVNVLARLRLAHHLLRDMRRAHFGRIVLISSSTAFQPLPLSTVYASSNAAVLSMGEGIACEVRDEGIEVLTVCPGGMETPFHERAGMRKRPNEKLMDPGAVADEILSALGRDRLTILPSLRSKAMALCARVLPRRWSAALWLRLMERLR